MNVAIDASSLVINRSSGLAEVVRNLISNLPPDKDKYHFTLYMNYFLKPIKKLNISYPNLTSRSLIMPRRLVDQWWQHDWPAIDLYLRKIDLFHSLHISVPPVKKIKTVLTVHDCRYMALSNLYSARDVEVYRKKMKKALSRVDYVITVSEFTKKELLKYFTFPEERVRTIKNGFNSISFQKEDKKEKIIRFIKDKKLPREYILYTGVLDPRKNLMKLIEAVQKCIEKIKDFPNLVLAGINNEQWLQSDQAKRANELGIFNNIYIAGIVNKDILKGLTKKATALCYPSLYEGFGFPPLEAMSLGVPVLAGKNSSLPEIAGNAACLVNPTSVDDISRGLEKIIYENDYRQKLIERGFNQIKKYSWKSATAEHIRLYKEILGN
jgi:glycosyltransferase involved in cell wall biosynthesis